MDSAAHAVLDTAELLEAILGSLDTRTLLLSQRRALFFEPVSVVDLRYDTRAKVWLDPQSAPDTPKPALLGNPLLPRAFQFPAKRELSSGVAFISKLSIAEFEKWNNPDASYRKMLLCQPALRRVEVQKSVNPCSFKARPYAKKGTIINSKGIRAGQVYHTLVASQRQMMQDDTASGYARGTNSKVASNWQMLESIEQLDHLKKHGFGEPSKGARLRRAKAKANEGKAVDLPKQVTPRLPNNIIMAQ